MDPAVAGVSAAVALPAQSTSNLCTLVGTPALNTTIRQPNTEVEHAPPPAVGAASAAPTPVANSALQATPASDLLLAHSEAAEITAAAVAEAAAEAVAASAAVAAFAAVAAAVGTDVHAPRQRAEPEFPRALLHPTSDVAADITGQVVSGEAGATHARVRGMAGEVRHFEVGDAADRNSQGCMAST